MSVIYEKKIKAFRNDTYVVERFESASEVIEVADKRPLKDGFHDRSEIADDPKWYGVKNWDEAASMMKTGYQPTVEKLKDVKVSLGGDGKRIKFTNEVQGFAPVVPLALMGVPNCMISTSMKKIKAKVLNVYYIMSVSASVSTSSLISAGQELLGALMELELQGYRFNLYCVQSYARPGEGGDVLCVKVKNASTPLDLKRISFPLTHPGFFRAVGFDWYGRMPKSKMRSGYGRPLYHDWSEDKIHDAFEEMFGEKCVVFDASNCVYKNKTQFKEVLTNAR